MNKKDRNNGNTHIVISPFSSDEKKLIYQAAKVKGVRRTKLYHDAIVEVAEGICNDATNNS
ncbi:MAG: hypothetical protein EOM59_19015 [Clostridia bacterium]|nr:hypothetical protein [Clostridia bacterium]